MPTVDLTRTKPKGTVTTAELATRLGCSLRSVKRYKAAGYIEPLQVNERHHLYNLRKALKGLHAAGMFEHVRVR